MTHKFMAGAVWMVTSSSPLNPATRSPSNWTSAAR